MRILVTGGAGFVGAHLARGLRSRYGAEVVCLDNLHRRGSERNLPALRAAGIDFVHGDIRSRDDLDDLPGNFDVMIEASAEPSVLAGLEGSPRYLLETNLVGTINCLEMARRRVGALVFLSTSRVYSIADLRAIALRESDTRLVLADGEPVPGLSEHGIAEGFATHRARSLYGASKLASELLVQEYADTYGLRAVIDRCGVIAGPGQFGKVDQGVFTLWVANHLYGLPLRYTGFGGGGLQVRDLLHPADLERLVSAQIEAMDDISGEVFNVGGGMEVSTSLLELTALCEAATRQSVQMGSVPESPAVDVPWYVTDSRRAHARFDWRPEHGVPQIVDDIAAWLRAGGPELRALFDPGFQGSPA